MLKANCLPITFARSVVPFTVTHAEECPFGHVGKIEAVKIIRNTFENIGLREAMDIVKANFGDWGNGTWYGAFDIAYLVAHIAKEKNSILREVRQVE